MHRPSFRLIKYMLRVMLVVSFIYVSWPTTSTNSKQQQQMTQFYDIVWTSDAKLNRYILNPSLLPVKDNLYLAVGRKFDGTPIEIKYTTVNATSSYLVMCMMSFDEEYDYFRCQTPLQRLDIQIDQRVLVQRIWTSRTNVKKSALYDWYWGPEDGRLFYGAGGRIMMYYTMNSNLISRFRTLFMTDVAKFYPTILDYVDQPDIMYSGQELGGNIPTSSSFGVVQKNWSPFYQNGKFLMSTSLGDPARTIAEVGEVNGKSIDVNLKNLTWNHELESCLWQDLDKNKWNIHLATNTLKVKLARRGSWNMFATEVYVAFYHAKLKVGFGYKHRILTWNDDQELSIRSVASTFDGHPSFSDHEQIYLTTMHYRNAVDVGYLDDVIVLGSGHHDRTAHAAFTTLEFLLQDEQKCN